MLPKRTCLYLQDSLWGIWVFTPGSKVSLVALFALSLAENEDKHAERD